MAILSFRQPGEPEGQGKQYMAKKAALRYIEKVQRKSDDHLALAERWGAKAVEFEEKLAQVRKRDRIIMGVLGGYAILSTIIWGCAVLGS